MDYVVKRATADSAQTVNWNSIPTATLMLNSGGEPPYRTAMQLCTNGDKLLFRFEVEDDVIKATLTQFNAPLYEEEVVELFIADTHNIHNYLELEINALGAVFLAQISYDVQGRKQINCVSKNCVNAEITHIGKYWIAYGELPLKLFEGEPSGKWRFNAHRIKRQENNDWILMSYSPTYQDTFHIPQRFATLTFEDKE